MQIQLKQPEIVEAIRDFVTKQGINLNGREVSISFTSGRKDKGLVADIDISDAFDLPDFPHDAVDQPAAKPALKVVPAADPEAQEPVQEVAAQAPAFDADEPKVTAEEPEEVVTDAPAPKSASLFN